MVRKVRTAILGAGFGGVAAAHALLNAGQDDFVLLERGDRPGGVWRANRYPGVACDVPSVLYSLSFAPNPDWTQRFSPGAEIQAYLREVMERYGIDRHLRTNADVVAARFDDDAGHWTLELRDGSTLEAEVLVSACGQLTRPAVPPLPGLERFEGQRFHSAEWPDDAHLDGRRVGVIGSGASAIQIVPAIAPTTEHTTVFQRSAPYIIPKVDGKNGSFMRWLYRRFPSIQRMSRELTRLQFENLVPVFTRTPPFRARFLVGVFRPLIWLQRFVQLRGDRTLVEKTTPDYDIGCKRVLLTSDWYPTLRRPDVDLCTSGITEVVADGVVTDDGTHHRLDALVLATGFTTVDFLEPLQVYGRQGMSIRDAWKDGAEAFLGMTVPGFPNFFMLYGPNTNHGTGSVIEVLEAQSGYLAQCVDALASGKADQLEVRRDVHEAFVDEIQTRLRDTVWTRCSNWYVNHAGRVTNNWPGTYAEYRQRTEALDLGDYETARPRRPIGADAVTAAP